MFAPVLGFTPSHRPLDKADMTMALENDSAGTRNGECMPNAFLELV